MKLHAIQTGTVRIKTAQVEGRGHGAMRQVAIYTDRNWTDWLPTYAPRLLVTGGAVTFCYLWNWSLTSITISSKMFCGTNFSTSDNMTICGIG